MPTNSNIFQLFFLVLPLLLAGSCSLRSQPTEEDYARENREHRAAVAKDFEVFLNASQSESARLAAVANRGSALDEKQNAALARLAANGQASDRIRATALSKVNDDYALKRDLAPTIADLLTNQRTPSQLRRAAADKFQQVSFSAFGRRQLSDLVVNTYRKLTADNELIYRQEAFSYLMGRNDDEARRILLRGLAEGSGQTLPIEEALVLLSLNSSTDDYPTVRPFLRAGQPEEVRLQALRILGGDKSQRAAILAITANGQESLTMRKTALASINANYPKQFSKYSLPLLQSDRTPAELRQFIIQTERFRRNENRLRNSKERDGLYRRDAFDEAVFNLRNNRDSSLAREALLYVKTLQLD